MGGRKETFGEMQECMQAKELRENNIVAAIYGKTPQLLKDTNCFTLPISTEQVIMANQPVLLESKLALEEKKH